MIIQCFGHRSYTDIHRGGGNAILPIRNGIFQLRGAGEPFGRPEDDITLGIDLRIAIRPAVYRDQGNRVAVRVKIIGQQICRANDIILPRHGGVIAIILCHGGGVFGGRKQVRLGPCHPIRENIFLDSGTALGQSTFHGQGLIRCREGNDNRIATFEQAYRRSLA